MQILIADDDRTTITILAAALRQWEFDIVIAHDGAGAWTQLQALRPSVAILDWMMPGVDGPEICRRLRADPALAHTYVILLTSRDARGDLVAGLEAGADDYLTKPFDREELRARVRTGVRITTLQQELATQVAELQSSLAKVKLLEGLLPMCSYCKRIRRSDQTSWDQMERYISEHSNAQFSHGICPECIEKVSAEWET